MPPWVKLYSSNMRRACANLSTAERSLLLVLLTHIGWRDNVLRIRGRPMRQEDIAELAGMSRRQAVTVLAGLVGSGVVVKSGHGPSIYYELSPLIVMAGTTDKEDDPRENFDNAHEDSI